MNEEDLKEIHSLLESWSDTEKAATNVAVSVSTFRNELNNHGFAQNESFALSAIYLMEILKLGRN